MIKQRRTIHQVLADARARYRRLEPQEAFAGDVSDVIGGFEAWRAAGLPVGPAGAQPPDKEAAGTTG